MGFPSVCYCVILPQPLILVLQLLDFLGHATLLCVSSLGLAAPPTPADEHPAYAPPPDLWAVELSSALAPDAPAHAPAPADSDADAAAATAIKARLPTVRYADLRTRRAAATCAVCLAPFEARHRVRELGNCSHAFHKACIDKWVDKGQATCPLCRALLLPAAELPRPFSS